MRKFLHRFELRLAVTALAALLLAQLGALSHAYSHDAVPFRAHQTGAVSHDPCNDCLAFAPLLSAAGTPAALPRIEPPGASPVTSSAGDSLVAIAPLRAFRSRAPPTTR